MRNDLTFFAPAGAGCVWPGCTREFSGSLNCGIACGASVRTRFWRDRLDVARERRQVHRPVIDADLAAGVGPGQRVLEPVHVVAVLEIFAGMGATAFLAVG